MPLINEQFPLSQLNGVLAEIHRRLDVLERPTGTQTAGLVAQVQIALANIASAITTALAGGFTTAGMHSTGDVVIDGAESVGGIFKNPAAYSNPITASFRALYVTSVDGQFGFNLSSRRFKQDIEEYAIDVAAARQLRVVTFRYIAAVELLGDEAAREVGLIAEEVDELGLSWLVDYNDESGLPEGIKFDRLALAALALEQDHETRLLRLERAMRSLDSL